MDTGRFAGPLAYSVLAVLMLSAMPHHANAQGHDSHAAGAISPPHKANGNEGALVSAVQDATRRFSSVTSVDGPTSRVTGSTRPRRRRADRSRHANLILRPTR